MIQVELSLVIRIKGESILIMKYTLATLKKYLINEMCELFFEYEGRKIMITPFNLSHYEIYIDDETKVFDNIESLLDFKIGKKSLRQILTMINVDIA